MSVIFELKERRVIPNWRDYKRTIQLGELGSTNESLDLKDKSIQRSINDWNISHNIGSAADLVNSAFVSGLINDPYVDEAKLFIKNNTSKASKSLLDLIDKIDESKTVQESSQSILEKNFENVNQLKAFIDNNAINKIISKTKSIARIQIYNPIIWVELARLYSMKGQVNKAENAILNALTLSPNNRFVLRSATRFFIHQENYDKAIYFLRKSESTKTDPWLISAHIAASSLDKRFSPFINQGKKLIISDNYSNYDLTELSSSIGTLEYNDGSIKKAKQFFDKSLLSPNDNSLAQMEWVSRDDNRFSIDLSLFSNVINPFEALALDNFNKGKWKESFENILKWCLDVPYSKRPTLIGSYIAGSLLDDKEAAIILCQVGLQSNPNDPSLLNNIVFSLATSDNLELLDKYANQLFSIYSNNHPIELKIAHLATLGLVAIKNNELNTGIDLYEGAIKLAISNNIDYLKNSAILNLTRVLVNINAPQKLHYLEIVKDMKLEESQYDLKLLKEKILKKI